MIVWCVSQLVSRSNLCCTYGCATCIWSSPASESQHLPGQGQCIQRDFSFIIYSEEHALQINRSQTNQPVRQHPVKLNLAFSFVFCGFFFFLLLKPLQMAKKRSSNSDVDQTQQTFDLFVKSFVTLHDGNPESKRLPACSSLISYIVNRHSFIPERASNN